MYIGIRFRRIKARAQPGGYFLQLHECPIPATG
jgi:hypothetical protein